ncbi:MAG: hypothetical protein PHU71_02040 [Candidatus Gracilibacteria bacterium]|nr:hypothetical protein [Candidatus Gracilibacteria bacterium]
MKKLVSLSFVALLTATLAMPAAFASVSFEDGELELGSKTNLSNTELLDCEFYPTANRGDEDEEIGIYVCSNDDEVDFEDILSKSDIKDMIDYYSDEYDYYPTSNNSSTRYTSTGTYRTTPTYTAPATPNYGNTKVCVQQPTLDGLGTYLDCSNLQGGNQQGYAYYDSSKVPRLMPVPANPYYGYGYYPYY